MQTTTGNPTLRAANLAADEQALAAHLATLSPPGRQLRVQIITPRGSSIGDYYVEIGINYRKLTVTYWGPTCSACWRVERYIRRGNMLRLDVSRRVGTERAQLIITAPDGTRDEAAPDVFPAPNLSQWKARVRAWLRQNLPACSRIVSLPQRRHPSPIAGWKAQSNDATWLVFTTTELAALRRLLGDALRALDTQPATHLWLLLPPTGQASLSPFLSLLNAPQLTLYEAAPNWLSIQPVVPGYQLPLITEPVRRWRYEPPTPAELGDLRRWFGDALETHCEVVPLGTSVLSVRWYGLECARLRRRVAATKAATKEVWPALPALSFGLTTLGQSSRPLTGQNQADFYALLENLARYRTPTARDIDHPLYRAHPERWLEAVVRRWLHVIDEALDPSHIRVQVPHFSREALGLADFVTLTRTGRLAVVELKADADPDFIWQGLTYWLRAVHHWQQGDFFRRGYFAGAQPDHQTLPQLYLLAPTLRFHSTVRAVTRRLRADIPVTLVGVNEQWRRSLRVVFRERLGTRPRE
ncbi:MAG: hypothetical protein ACUVR8_00710 [Acidobacteriota bacterium]